MPAMMFDAPHRGLIAASAEIGGCGGQKLDIAQIAMVLVNLETFGCC